VQKNFQPTQERISDFLALHERAMIVLDKIHGELRSDWSTAIMNDALVGSAEPTYSSGAVADLSVEKPATPSKKKTSRKAALSEKADW
jgi:hypothetical protein